MRLHRSLPLAAAAALLLAGCGSPGGPSAAENTALQAIPHAQSVLSYPIAANAVADCLPASETKGLGAPLYIFAVSVQGTKQPTWVLAGQQAAHALHVYKDIAQLAAHARTFPLGAGGAALRALAAGSLGKLPLQVVGVRARTMTGAQLGKLGVKLPGKDYTVVSVLSLPAGLHGSQPSVANFVESGGKLLTEYGTSH